MTDDRRAGLYESLLTHRLRRVLEELPPELASELSELRSAEAPDRVSRHVAAVLEQALTGLPDDTRTADAIRLAIELLELLDRRIDGAAPMDDRPVEPGAVLASITHRRPDGTPGSIARPLTPLLDTTLFTNAPGEPALLHEIKGEIPSADEIDAVVAFIRFAGISRMLSELRVHCEAGKPLRILTTTYTNSTEGRALDALASIGADIRVSYDVTSTRLHAKAWIFHRHSGYSTAYVGSSNLTHWAQVDGLEWNVRLSQARNRDAVAKMAAVFDSYWSSRAFEPYDADEFRVRTATRDLGDERLALPPTEIELRPFQREMLESLEAERGHGHHRNLLVAATGTGKTVMAAVDYARLRGTLPRHRLLFVAHREEILEQSRRTFAYAIRDAAFGEKWVGGARPSRFEHVFASIQSLNATGFEHLARDHFDVVVIDEFHHAAAPSYAALLEHVKPRELLGLTATPERADGLDVLRFFDGRIAAELRLWDAVDQQHLVPFDYFGVFDGADLTAVPWRRGRGGSGYDADALTNVLTADHAWANRVIEQVRQKVASPTTMSALGFCVTVEHARFMAERFNAAGLTARAVWGDSPMDERRDALAALARGDLRVLFTVDLFNEGIDVPNVDTLLMLRPTESGTLFLQQLGRGLRKAERKASCTVLDFVANHNAEFRYDKRFRALLGGSRRDVQTQVEEGFPFLPAGCSMDLDPVAREVVLRSIKNAIPSGWRERCDELAALGDVSLGVYLHETDIDLEDVYAGNHSWTEMRRRVGLSTDSAGPDEPALLRAVGRLLHVDDDARLTAYRGFVLNSTAPSVGSLDGVTRRKLRMLVGALTTLPTSQPLQAAVDQLWQNTQVLAELRELFDLLATRVTLVHHPLALPGVPLHAHARYTRNEILAAFDVGAGARPPSWQTGVWWAESAGSDLFAFTLDKSSGGFSPTTRYRDFALSESRIHWESQGATSVGSEAGQRYIHHRERGTNIVLFARLRADSRAFWCLGTAQYVTHRGDRPIAFEWELDEPLPVALYRSFAAAVA